MQGETNTAVLKDPERPIFGSEMEWGIVIKLSASDLVLYPSSKGFVAPENRDLQPIVFSPVPLSLYKAGLRRSRHQLSNGARFYIDTIHPEYSTPEDETLDGFAANEIAGERIVLKHFERARDEGRIADFKLRKCTISDNNSFGYHLNYLVDRSVLDITLADQARKYREEENKRTAVIDWSSPELSKGLEHLGKLEMLGLHFATRPIYAGAGGIRQAKGRPRGQLDFVIGQKTSDLSKDFSEQTTSDKPVVNMRDNPYADRTKHTRLHDTCPDPHMSPWAMKMQIGTTHLLLEALKYGIKLDESIILKEGDLVGLAQHTTLDTTCSKPYAFKDGTERTALDIQYALWRAANRVAEFQHLSTDQQWVLQEWKRALDDLAQDPMLLADRADWVLRLQKINEYNDLREQNGAERLPFSAPFIREIDKHYDRICELPEQQAGESDKKFAFRISLYAGMIARKGAFKQWMPPEALIEERVIHPPKTTRAYGRGRLVAKFPPAGEAEQRDYWARYDTPWGTQIHMLDPRQPSTPEIETLLKW